MKEKLSTTPSRRNVLTLLAGIPMGKMFSSIVESSEVTRSSGSTVAWPMFQFNPANTGSMPDTEGPKQHGQELWSSELEAGLGTTPVVQDGTVYTASGQWDPNTGEEILEDTYIYAFDAETGEEQWRYEAEAPVGHTPIATDALYFADDEGTVYSLDWDKSVHWTYETETSPAQLTIDDHLYLVGAKDEGVAMAIDPDGLETLWETQLSGQVNGVGVGPYLYCSSFDGSVSAIGKENGSIQEDWNIKTNDWITAAPTYHAESVVVGSHDGYLYAFDAYDGTEEWKFDTGAAIEASVAVKDGTVFVGNHEAVPYAIDIVDATEQWQFEEADVAILSAPAVVDGVVYIGANDSKIYAVDAADGTETWNIETDAFVASSPAVTDGKLYIGSGDSNVYAIEEQDTDRKDEEEAEQFDPAKHGFGFYNWAGMIGETVDGESFEYTQESVALETVEETVRGWPIADKYVPLFTRLVHTAINHRPTRVNGHCYGMAHAAREYFRHPSRLPRDVDSASEIPKPTGQYEAVGDRIVDLQTSQLLNLGYWKMIFSMVLPNQAEAVDSAATLSYIKDRIDSGQTVGIALGAGMTPDHAVLAYDYEDAADGRVQIFVYENEFAAQAYEDYDRAEVSFDSPPTRVVVDAESGEMDSDSDYIVDTPRDGQLTFDSYGVIEPELDLDVVDGLLEDPEGFFEQFDASAIFGVNSPVRLSVDPPADAEFIRLGSELYAETGGGYSDGVFIPDAEDGEYDVTVEGEADGEYTLEMVAIQGEASVREEVTETITEGGTQTYTARMSSDPDETNEIAPVDDDTAGGVDDGTGDEINGDTGDDTDDDSEDDPGDDDGFGPGLGVGGALIGVGGAAYLLKRRLTDEDSE